MKLFVDAGNTRIKVRDQQGRFQAFTSNQVFVEYVAAQAVTELYVASVRGEVFYQLLNRCASANGFVLTWLAYSSPGMLPTDYQQPSKLGIDRLVAASEACALYGDCMVVDIGTAMTIDFVKSNRHLGGFIVPGLDTMVGSLGLATAHVTASMTEAGITGWAPAVNTQQAVYEGAISAIAAQIEYHAQHWQNDCAKIVVTGGSASLIEPAVQLPLCMQDELVLKGIERLANASGDE